MTVNLDDRARLRELDAHGMLERLARFPDQAREALELGRTLDWTIRDVEHVVVAGMGGSGIAGDLMARFLSVPVAVCKGHDLPPLSGKTLLIAVSYSGNTEETLSALRAGLERGVTALCVTSGGRLAQLAQEHRLPLVRVPAGYPPRLALGYLAFSLLAWAEGQGLSPTAERWPAALAALEVLGERCRAEVPAAHNPAKALAQRLAGTVPLFYGTHANTAVVAQRWKGQINENAKQPAFWNALPELNHNEIVQFTSEKAFSRLLPQAAVVTLRNDFDRPQVRHRLELLAQVLRERGLAVIEVRAEGENELAQVLSQIYLGDWMSAYLALGRGVDPTPVVLIDELKARLG